MWTNTKVQNPWEWQTQEEFAPIHRPFSINIATCYWQRMGAGPETTENLPQCVCLEDSRCPHCRKGKKPHQDPSPTSLEGTKTLRSWGKGRNPWDAQGTGKDRSSPKTSRRAGCNIKEWRGSWQTGQHMPLLETAAPINWCQVRRGGVWCCHNTQHFKRSRKSYFLCEISWFLKAVYCLKFFFKDSVAK